MNAFIQRLSQDNDAPNDLQRFAKHYLIKQDLKDLKPALIASHAKRQPKDNVRNPIREEYWLQTQNELLQWEKNLKDTTNVSDDNQNKKDAIRIVNEAYNAIAQILNHTYD